MKIDKSIGRWEDNNTTHLDDVAYYLYIQYLLNYYENDGNRHIVRIYPTQYQLLKGYNRGESFFLDFYNKANNLIRKEKLQKINENR